MAKDKKRKSGRTGRIACKFGRHAPGKVWVMRPALVGAGIVIPKVHFDRPCSRCRAIVERRWTDIEGECRPLDIPLSLVDWMLAQGARVEVPPGEIRVPSGSLFDQSLEQLRSSTT